MCQSSSAYGKDQVPCLLVNSRPLSLRFPSSEDGETVCSSLAENRSLSCAPWLTQRAFFPSARVSLPSSLGTPQRRMIRKVQRQKACRTSDDDHCLRSLSTYVLSKTGLDANGLFILFKKLFEEISIRVIRFSTCLQSPLSMVLSLTFSVFRSCGLWHHGQHLFMKIVHWLFLACFMHEIEGFLMSLFKHWVVPCIFSARVPDNVFRVSVYRGRDRLLLHCCSSFVFLLHP